MVGTGRLDRERNPADRGEDGVERDDADGGANRLVAVRLDVAPATLDGHLEVEATPLVEGADEKVRVEDRDLGRRLDVGGPDLLRPGDRHPEGDRLVDLGTKHQV